MDGKSLNITEEKLKQLKKIIPEAFTEDKIDWEKLKAALGETIEFKNERYVLNWAGKSEAFRVLQSPATATLSIEQLTFINDKGEMETVNSADNKKYSPEQWSMINDKCPNVFIEGENLEVLKVLQKSYFGRIKMIYIDPPYNTGNDNFIYPDKFSETREEYLSRIGDKDETGYMTREGLFRKNSKDSGHYHSNWLSMIYPRLFLARNLLRDDGVIFVSIGDDEAHNLRLLMNEVFGEENFRNSIVIKRGAKSVQNQFETIDRLGSAYETVLMYSKRGDVRFPKLEVELERSRSGSWNNHWRGTNRPTMRYELFGIMPSEGQWRWIKERSIAAITNYSNMLKELNKTESNITDEDIDSWYLDKVNAEDDRIDLLRLSKNGKPEHYIPPSNNVLGNDVWFDFPPHSTSLLKNLFGKKIFDNPKPLQLLYRCMSFMSKNDIILDFFAGSATTAHAVLDLNKEDGGSRKFICVQLPEKCEENSEAYKAGYKTIAEIGKERIRRVIGHLTLNSEHLTKNNKNQAEQATLFDKEADKKMLNDNCSMINDKCSMLNDLGFKVFKLRESNFKIWRTRIETEEQLVEQLQQHLEPLDENAKTEDVLYELLLKSGVPLTAKIEEKEGVYLVNDNEIALILKKVNEKIIKSVINAKPQKVITLDRLFKNNDQLKTNTALTMKNAGIEFKVI